MEQRLTGKWWDLRQTLIWIATRDSTWAHELRPKQGLFGREERRAAFGYDFDGALLQGDVLQQYAEKEGLTLLKADLIDAIAGDGLVAVEHGARLAASNFLKASVGDDYVGSSRTGFLSIFRLDWRPIDGVVTTADAPYWQPMFLVEQVRACFPPVGAPPLPISEAGTALLKSLEEGRYRSVELEIRNSGEAQKSDASSSPERIDVLADDEEKVVPHSVV